VADERDSQLVILHGGSADGKVVRAHLPMETHREYFRAANQEWAELYRYEDGGAITEDGLGYGRLPVMSFLRRVKADDLTRRRHAARGDVT
jgi:hypothetical protein